MRTAVPQKAFIQAVPRSISLVGWRSKWMDVDDAEEAAAFMRNVSTDFDFRVVTKWEPPPAPEIRKPDMRGRTRKHK